MVIRAALFLAITALAPGCSGSDGKAPKVSRAQIEAALQKEVPAGSSRADVVAFLDKGKVEHSGHRSDGPPDTILAIYRNVEGGTATVEKAIQITFKFNDDKLAEYSVSEKLTGP